MRPQIQSADHVMRPTRAEIDLDAIAHNYGVVSTRVGASRVLAVVKADAYGHGLVEVARRLEREGAFGFGVALAEEGLELREAGVKGEILVLNGVFGGAHREVLSAGLTPVVYDLDQVRAFAVAAKGRSFGVHLKIDTGMSRLGVPARELASFVEKFRNVRGARIDGVMTHFASADTDSAFTAMQLKVFASARALLARQGLRPRLVHAANSAAALEQPTSRFDFVRVGVALYGVSPLAAEVEGLRPAMRLRSEVIALRTLKKGQSIGYGGTFVAAHRMRVATVPLGYGDGLFRAVSNRGHVLVRGHLCPLVGNVSMDLTSIDVTDVPDCVNGDEVVFLGSQGQGCVDASAVARAARTIPYEVLTNVSRRVPRFYTDSSAV